MALDFAHFEFAAIILHGVPGMALWWWPEGISLQGTTLADACSLPGDKHKYVSQHLIHGDSKASSAGTGPSVLTSFM